MKNIIVQKDEKVDSEALEINFYYLSSQKMKYCIEWEYKDNCMKWKMQVWDIDNADFKDFIMYWMPWIIQDLFDKFCDSLKEKAKESDISEDKILWVISLMSIMCQNTLSEKLTESLNNFLADDSEEEKEEETNQNRWNSLLNN